MSPPNDKNRDKRYPKQNPNLPEIRQVKIIYAPEINSVNCWLAILFNNRWGTGRTIAKSPWKKLTWKMAKRYMEAMG